MSSRIDTLRSLITQDPANSRFRYMLAMELSNGGDTEGAVTAFRDLIAADPNYSAAYFHGGQALEKLGRPDEARVIYQQGIEATTRNGDMHTRSELQGALDLLG
jgi:Tfp pilus assembly protein PilF